MAWGTGEKAKIGREKHFKNLQLINAKARELHLLKIKRISRVEMSRYHGLFAHTIIYNFSIKEDMPEQSVLLLAIMNMYNVFYRTDAYLWGLVHNNNALRRLTERVIHTGYVDVIRTKHNVAGYYLSIKGKEFVVRFNKYYDTRVKQILKSNANGNIDQKHRYASKKLKEVYKPRAGRLRQDVIPNSERGGADN